MASDFASTCPLLCGHCIADYRAMRLESSTGRQFRLFEHAARDVDVGVVGVLVETDEDDALEAARFGKEAVNFIHRDQRSLSDWISIGARADRRKRDRLVRVARFLELSLFISLGDPLVGSETKHKLLAGVTFSHEKRNQQQR